MGLVRNGLGRPPLRRFRVGLYNGRGLAGATGGPDQVVGLGRTMWDSDWAGSGGTVGRTKWTVGRTKWTVGRIKWNCGPDQVDCGPDQVGP